MKSSKKEIQRLEDQLKDWQDKFEAEKALGTKEVLGGYILETKRMILRVQKAHDRKQARKAKRRYSVSEGDAMPSNMDLDGELIKVPAPRASLTLVQPDQVVPLTKVYDFPQGGPALITLVDPLPDENITGFVDQFGTSVTLEEAEKLNARGRKARRAQLNGAPRG